MTELRKCRMPASQRLRRDSLGVLGSSCARLFAATLSDDAPRGVEACTGADVLRAGACTDFPKFTYVVGIIFWFSVCRECTM
jgi:hypothetical protein